MLIKVSIRWLYVVDVSFICQLNTFEYVYAMALIAFVVSLLSLLLLHIQTIKSKLRNAVLTVSAYCHCDRHQHRHRYPQRRKNYCCRHHHIINPWMGERMNLQSFLCHFLWLALCARILDTLFALHITVLCLLFATNVKWAKKVEEWWQKKKNIQSDEWNSNGNFLCTHCTCTR